ncbi:MAG: GNAT family N-acetyltransferase [Chitinivibrionales bacterium]|nr:GNAT family N-acetyltransferase [Chitinivibrionales bacterium]
MSQIRYQEGGGELLDELAPLWRRLADHHAGISPDFGIEFTEMTWDWRKKDLLDKAADNKLHVALAYPDSHTPCGYAVGTVNDRGLAEIDSLFVAEQFRGCGIGSELVKRTLAWMDLVGVESKMVNVAVGNEQAIDFYKRFDFFPRVISLMRKDK